MMTVIVSAPPGTCYKIIETDKFDCAY